MIGLALAVRIAIDMPQTFMCGRAIRPTKLLRVERHGWNFVLAAGTFLFGLIV
mgnify:CR=1 FL=1